MPDMVKSPTVNLVKRPAANKLITSVTFKICIIVVAFTSVIYPASITNAHDTKAQIRPNAKIYIKPEYRHKFTQSRRYIVLPDRASLLQTDKRWAYKTIGGSNETIKTDGCLVTAVAMALVNLGYHTDPGDLATKLKAHRGFNSRGWLVWDGIERATDNYAKAYYFRDKEDSVVRACLAQGFYPLVKFNLPSRQSTHWVVVVRETAQGFAVRDPLIKSKRPILLNTRTKSIHAVRCIGTKR